MRVGSAPAVQAALAIAGASFVVGCSGATTPATPVPAPTPTCASLTVAFQGGDPSHGTARGELTLEATDPETALDFTRPYTIEVPNGGANLDVPGLRPTIGVFVSDLAFTPLGDGFRQSMTLEWISELEVRAGAPDCEPVSVACDLEGCSGP